MPLSQLLEGSNVPLAGRPVPGVGEEVVCEGIGVAPGVTVGQAYLYEAGAWQAEREELSADGVEAEIERFERAVARSERELRKIVTVAEEKLGGTSAGIFDAQQLVLRDPTFYDAVVARIRGEHVGAGYAVQGVLDRIRDRMAGAADPALRERAADFDDVRNRVLRNLQQGRAMSQIDPERIVVARHLTAADVLLFSRRGVLGLVLDFGGPTSHVAIMARALGVPAVVSLHGLSGSVRTGDTVILDGLAGRVIVRPSAGTLVQYRARQARYEALRDEIHAAPDAAATADGHPLALQANVEFREELPLLHAFGADGIGLFRTEMLFLAQGRALDEEQQLGVYREALRAAAPYPVTFRLIDLGGDKVLPLAHREPNPFLGWRGVRILLDKPDLLRPQLRAILRAAADGPARILVPMVTEVEELRAIRAAVRDTAAELAAEGLPHAADVPVGVMIEVPAAALLADRFAAEADFFSVGTNDLTQFTLGVDRGNDLVAGRYRELHPAVLHLLQRTIEAAHAAGITVSLCGELAGNPRATALLVGLGFDALSASPAYLGLTRRVLIALTLPDAQALARAALDAADADEVAALLAVWLYAHTPELAAVLLSDPLDAA